MNFKDFNVENAPPEASGGQASLVLHSYYSYYDKSGKAEGFFPEREPPSHRPPETMAGPSDSGVAHENKHSTPVPRKSRCAARGPGREGAPPWSAWVRRRRRVGPPGRIGAHRRPTLHEVAASLPGGAAQRVCAKQ